MGGFYASMMVSWIVLLCGMESYQEIVEIIVSNGG